MYEERRGRAGSGRSHREIALCSCSLCFVVTWHSICTLQSRACFVATYPFPVDKQLQGIKYENEGMKLEDVAAW